MATVLIVDDDPSIVALLQDVVIALGHEVLACTNGYTALTLAQIHRPALIMTDLSMPDMNGYDLIGALRADPLLVNIPVLLISAGTRPSTLPAKTAFLLKPLNLSLVESFLRQLAASPSRHSR